MDINANNLRTAGIGFNAAYTRGLGQAASQFDQIATTVPSGTKVQEYAWLGKMPSIRKWLGDRVINNISQSKYQITNEPYELTISVDRDDIEDDNLGVYSPLFEEMGRSVTAFPNELCFGMLKAGFASNCYDGQFFFDTDHPVLDVNGNPTSVSNVQAGANPAWFLIDSSRAIKPIIYQMRRDFGWVKKDQVTDDNVFHKKEFVYGADGRMSAGYGFWQFAFGSRATLNAANYAAARAALLNMKGDYGRPLGITPNLLVVDPSNESAALKLMNNELDAAGGSNEWKGTAKVLQTPWLA